MSSTATTSWSKEEEKAFENAIAMHWKEKQEGEEEEDSIEQWDKIASMVPSKSMEELKRHFQMLLDDINAIEAGHIPVPNYAVDDNGHNPSKDSHHVVSGSEKRLNGNSSAGHGSGFSSGLAGHDGGGKGGSRAEQERRKGIPWTEEEHRYFCDYCPIIIIMNFFIFFIFLSSWLFYY